MKIYLELPPARGSRYRAHFGSLEGEVIAEDSSTPLTDAARVLKARGIHGELEMWDNIRPYYRLKGDIDRLAASAAGQKWYLLSI